MRTMANLEMLANHGRRARSAGTSLIPTDRTIRNATGQSQSSYFQILGKGNHQGRASETVWLQSTKPLQTPARCSVVPPLAAKHAIATTDHRTLRLSLAAMASIVRPSLLRHAALASRCAAAAPSVATRSAFVKPSALQSNVLRAAAFHNSSRRNAIMPPGPREWNFLAAFLL